MGLFTSLFGRPAAADSGRVKELRARGAVILDVRTPEEFAGGHVKGAKNIPVQILGSKLRDVGAKDQPVIVYCRSGGRSAAAASMLKQAGFAEIVDVGPMSAFPR